MYSLKRTGAPKAFSAKNASEEPNWVKHTHGCESQDSQLWIPADRDDVVVANDVLLEAHKEDVAIANGRKWDGAPVDGANVDVKEKLG